MISIASVYFMVPLIISSGICETGNLTYCASGSSEQRYMLEISAVQYLAFGVEIVEFQWTLIVSIEAE